MSGSGVAASSLGDWIAWPVAMIPVAAIGLLFAMRVWHATPQKEK